ncbi:MAG: Ldh family oxidoreductase [Solirubrobacteraceae bacterium]
MGTANTLVPASGLAQRATEILTRAGLGAADATIVADSLVDADLRGVHSHGVGRLDIYVERLRRGGNVAHGRIATVVDAPAVAVLDGAGLLSQVPSMAAVALARGKARAVGCATVVVRGASHFGAAGYWARLLAEDGLVGVASTNTTPLMAPWGGSTAAIGTNPIAISFPSAELPPVVVDIATSEATWGKLLNAAAAGEAIPTDWALDEHGRGTTDAATAVRARRLLPFGRHKGYALAVGIELLTGALASACCLAEVGDMYGEPANPMRNGHLFIAIDPRRMRPDGSDYATTVTRIQREINSLPPAGGTERVLWPGQLEAELAQKRRDEGIPLPGPILTTLASLEPQRPLAGTAS